MKTPIIDGFSQAGLVSYLTARQYEQLYWPTFFPIQDVNSLDGKTLIGAVGSRVAAHVISYNTKAPKAGRKGFTTKNFDIPKTAQSRIRDEKDILDLNITLAIRGNDAVLEEIFNDVNFVYDSCQARMEWFALQAISKTKIQLTTANNPQGIVNETVIDFGMPSANKKVVAVTWTTGHASTMTPITDIKAVVKAGRDAGVTFQRILMHPDAYDLMTASTEFQTACKSLLVGESQLLGFMGLETTNKVLQALRLPPIALIETSVGIEGKDGTITEANPYDSNHVVFIPEVKLGNMYNGPIAEEIEKPEGLTFAKRGNIWISVKKDWNPIAVTTKAECNVFPSWPTVDRCYSMYIASASTWA
jgi:hypothetical protein